MSGANALSRGVRMLALLLVLAAFAMSAGGAGAQPAAGGLSGRVVNGSAGGAPVAGATVTLYALSDQSRSELGSATTDASGTFRLDGVQPDPLTRYAASVSYAGVTYAALSSADGGSSGVLPAITVYETTESADAITVQRAVLVLAGADPKRGLLTIVESYHVDNGGQRTYIGAAGNGQRQALRFPLFAGARTLTPLEGFTLDDATSIAGGFALTSPVRPGTSTISFTYDVPYRTASLSLRRAVVYPTSTMEVVLSGGLHVSSPQLATRSTVDLGGKTFDSIQAQSLPAGTAVLLSVSGLPARAGSGLDVESLPAEAALLSLALAALAVAVMVLRRRDATLAPARLRQERARLLRVVADLDDRMERGAIDAAPYREQREAAMRGLERLTLRIRAAEGAADGRLPPRGAAGATAEGAER